MLIIVVVSQQQKIIKTIFNMLLKQESRAIGNIKKQPNAKETAETFTFSFLFLFNISLLIFILRMLALVNF